MKTGTKIFTLVLLALVLIGFIRLLPTDSYDWITYKVTRHSDLPNKESTVSPGVISLNKKDINDSSLLQKNGYVIDKPGKYIIDEDINWSVSTPDSFAITIAANNVTLDGVGHFIKQVDTTVKHAIGIQVKAGFENIRIQNIVLDAISGGGIWFRGGNSHLTVKGIKTVNCGYFGLTQLDAKGLAPNAPTAVTQGILFDGGYGRPIKDAQVINCTFAESGILRTKEPKYETACGAIQVYQASDIIIKGCAIDGCIGRDTSLGITLIGISRALTSDVIITDIISNGNAQGVYYYDIDGELQDTISTAIYPNVDVSQFGNLLDTHGVKPQYSFSIDDSAYPLETSHLKGIIPKHRENERLLFEEHTWKEFRTLSRLVCHNSHKMSKTSAIYSKWVELFCERALGVKVRVDGGFANLYPSGDTPLPAHRDKFGKWIIGLSFGETRTLDFIADNNKSDISSFELGGGDVFLFSPSINETHEHRMLAETKRKGRRINLTYFLEVLPGEDSRKLVQVPELKEDSIPTFEEALDLYDQISKSKEKNRIILQDEEGNFYEEVNGKLIQINSTEEL